MKPRLNRVPRWPLATAASLTLASAALAANPDWPNAPDEDPREELPDDPGYYHIGSDGIAGGTWNYWSFYPESWIEPNGGTIRPEERDVIGTGIHADRGWQITTGDRRVIIGVADSGINWDTRGLRDKYYLNRAELDHDGARPDASCLGAPPADPLDIDGNGYFNVADYRVCPGQEALLDGAGNGDGMLEPEDLILQFSDGVDADENGYIDDISGWDFYWDDNNPRDDTRYGHGTGEARDSAEEGNDGVGDLGVCPECSVLMLRVGDSFVADVNNFAAGVVFAVDSGASLIQSALGTINMTTFAYDAIEYAYNNNVAVVASAADELSYHHNMPSTANHTLYVHAVTHDEPGTVRSSTFLNFNNCTNYGAQLLLSTAGASCSSEAVGRTSGHVGLLYAASLGTPNTSVPGGIEPLDPPLSAEEVRGLLIQSVDDINVNPLDDDPEKFPSGPGWDLHFGYGRNNVRNSLDLLVAGHIPPEVDIVSPYWFETFYPMRDSSDIEIVGRIGDRVDGRESRYDSYRWRIEVAPGPDPKEGWIEMDSGETGGVNGTIATLDATILYDALDIESPPSDPHAHSFTIRLHACADAADGEEVCNEFRKLAFLDHDPDLFDAFPMHLMTSGEASSRFYDLNGDGADELIHPAANGLLHAYQSDGSELPGWPVEMLPHRGLDPALPGNHTAQCAFREDRTGCPAWGPVPLEDARGTFVTNAPAIGDLDGVALPWDEQVPQVVMSTWDGWVYVFEADGSLADGFPVRTDEEGSRDWTGYDDDNRIGEGIAGGVTLADLDNNGDYELIAPAQDGFVYVWDHDGTAHPGFPVECRDNEEEGGGQRSRILATAAVGDVDNDGFEEIVVGTNEVYGEIESRMYLIHHDGNLHENGPFENLDPDRETPGPYRTAALQGEVLPVVGRGNPSNAIMADYDYDGFIEFSLEGIGGVPRLFEWDGEELDEERAMSIATENFGPLSNSTDDFSYTLINNGAFGFLDDSGDLAFVKGTAGFRFALAFLEGGKRASFDHQLSAWNTRTGMPVEGFPQVQDDWQFFMTPTIVDLDNDFYPEVLNGTGGYRLRAHDYRGEEPEGWPKHTGGWIISSPAVGDFDGDGTYDVSVSTRNGWLFVWRTEGSTEGAIEWNGYAHDPLNTNNYETPMPRGPNRDPVPGDDAGPEDESDVADLGEPDAGDPDTSAEPDAGGDAGDLPPSGDASGGDAADTGSTGDGADDGGCCAIAAPGSGRANGALLLSVIGLALLAHRRRHA